MTADPHTPLQSTPPAPVQPALQVEGSNGRPAIEGASPPQESRVGRGELWLRRLSVLMFVILCATCGVLLVILPWSLQWTDNSLLWGHPDLKAILAHPFVRGVCSGVGFLDLWIGFREAVQYHEEPIR